MKKLPFHWPNFFSSNNNNNNSEELTKSGKSDSKNNSNSNLSSPTPNSGSSSRASSAEVKARKKSAASSSSSFKKPKKVKGGKKSTKTKNFHTVTFSQGAGYRAPPKEDRIIAIEDLYNFVHSNFASYNVSIFGEARAPNPPSKVFPVPTVENKSSSQQQQQQQPQTVISDSSLQDPNSPVSNEPIAASSPLAIPGNQSKTVAPGSSILSTSAPESSGFLRAPLGRGIHLFRSETTGSEMTPTSVYDNTTENPVDKFKLFAVFDGHCGKIAASFLQYRFPFELCGCDAFKEGKYEQALKDTYQNMHYLLKNAQKYGPERPYSDYSSGATASVALVTPTMTYFAFLGDSPIITWKHGDPRPDMLFNEHDADNPLVQKNLLESNIFLVLVREKVMSIVYYLVTQAMVKQALFRIAHEQLEGDAGLPPMDAALIGSNSEYDTEFDYTEHHSHDDGALDSPLENEEDEDDESDDGENRNSSMGLMESTSDAELRAPGSPLSAVDEDAFPDSDTEADPLLTNERKNYKEARLDDDQAKVVVRSEEEILKEENERLTRSIKKLNVDEVTIPGSVAPNPSDPTFSSSGDGITASLQTHTYTVPGETLEYDDIRVGLSALNVYGSIGDTAYDPDIFNTFLDEILAFKEQRIHELEATRQERYWEEMANFTVMSSNSGVIPFTHDSVTSSSSTHQNHLAPGNTQNQMSQVEEDFDPNDFSFEELRDFIMKRPAWTLLKSHMYLMKSEDKCSRILLAAIRYLDQTHRLTKPGLLRIPEITSIPTKDLRMFIVTSDGVIRFYEKFREQFQFMIMKHEQNPERLASKLKDYMKWLGDDRSIIICRVGPQAQNSVGKNSSLPPNTTSTGSNNSPGVSPSDDLPTKKVVSSKKLYHQLRNKRSTVTLPPHQVTTTTNPNLSATPPSSFYS